MSNGTKIVVRGALTKLQQKRDYSLKEAVKVVKKQYPNRDVEIVWKERVVTVWKEKESGKEREKEVDAFSQMKTELGGTFSGACEGLSLP